MSYRLAGLLVVIPPANVSTPFEMFKKMRARGLDRAELVIDTARRHVDARITLTDGTAVAYGMGGEGPTVFVALRDRIVAKRTPWQAVTDKVLWPFIPNGHLSFFANVIDVAAQDLVDTTVLPSGTVPASVKDYIEQAISDDTLDLIAGRLPPSLRGRVRSPLDLPPLVYVPPPSQPPPGGVPGVIP